MLLNPVDPCVTVCFVSLQPGASQQEMEDLTRRMNELQSQIDTVSPQLCLALIGLDFFLILRYGSGLTV